MRSRIILWIVVVLGIVGVFYYTNTGGESVDAGSSSGWMIAELKDVRTGESFKISDFSGKKVLLESFAVWCPTCTKQQREIKKLHDELGDDFVSIGLDTDASEDEARVLEHVTSNGFDWRYAISPEEVTKSLISDFGRDVVNAPGVPMILICEDGSARKLGGFGARSVEKLKEEIEAGCE